MFFLQVKNEVKSNNQYVTNEWASEIMCNSRSNIVLRDEFSMLWFSLVNLPVKTINKSIKMHVVELRVESRELRAESCRELRFDS